ncbi:PRKG1 [Symbiodinium natans]|uniref:PRKG1 protein n=1 Tax=Symbiodinium natans TaxID=878477 RepID=A0A812JLG1_9DINO|nr:PRKG1 [Symbiodinium natans]
MIDESGSGLCPAMRCSSFRGISGSLHAVGNTWFGARRLTRQTWPQGSDLDVQISAAEQTLSFLVLRPVLCCSTFHSTVDAGLSFFVCHLCWCEAGSPQLGHSSHRSRSCKLFVVLTRALPLCLLSSKTSKWLARISKQSKLSHQQMLETGKVAAGNSQAVSGTHFFVVAQGEFCVLKDNNPHCYIGSGAEASSILGPPPLLSQPRQVPGRGSPSVRVSSCSSGSAAQRCLPQL